MAPATSNRWMTSSRRRRCRTGRRSGGSAATALGPARTARRKPRGPTPCGRAAAPTLAPCTAMITRARGPAGFPFRISRASGARSAAPVGRCEMSARTDTPRAIALILAWPWLLPLARIALVSAFLIGGLQKLVDFQGAIAEQAHFGLQPAWLWAAAAVIVELGGSALVILGRFVWLGAGGLGVLTAVAMFASTDFWAKTGHDRFLAVNAFFEHLGLIAGLVLVSILSLRQGTNHRYEASHVPQSSTDHGPADYLAADGRLGGAGPR